MQQPNLPFVPVKPLKDCGYYVFWALSIVFLPILLPFKLGSFVLAMISTQVFSMLFEAVDPEKPLHPWLMRFIQTGQRFNSRWVTFSLGYFFYSVKGKEHSPQKHDKVVVCNHVSSLDPVFLISVGIPSFLSKPEVARMPVFGAAAKSLQCIFIYRGNGKSKLAAEQMKKRVATDGMPLTCVFPEGTTTNQKALLTFKQGAFELGVSVRMLTIRYGTKYFDPSDASKSMVSAILPQFLTLFNSFSVTYLGEYVPSASELSYPAEYASNVQELLAKHMRVSVSPLTVFDKFYYREQSPDFFTWEKTSDEFKAKCGRGFVKSLVDGNVTASGSSVSV